MLLKRITVLVLATSLVILACGKKEDVIKIGEFGSLTGLTATFGINTDRGIKMAVEKINQQGGVLGKKVVVIVEDDQGKPEEAATAVKKLVNQDKVIAVLGEVASSRSLAGAPICQESQVPMISPSSTNPKVTQVGDFIFRVCFIDPFQGEVMAKFAYNTLKVKRAAIIRDIKNDYSVGLADYFKDTFTKLGGQIVADQSYSEGDIDFRAQLTAIKPKTPQTIFVPGYYTEVGLLVRQARDLGIKIPIIGGDGWDSPKLVEIGGKALNGCYYSNHYSPEDTSQIIQNFVKEFQTKYNEIPDAMAPLGYDAAMILFEAIKKVGSTEGSKIRDAIAQTTDFSGITGKITINEERNAVKPAVVLKVEDEKIRFVETVNP